MVNCFTSTRSLSFLLAFLAINVHFDDPVEAALQIRSTQQWSHLNPSLLGNNMQVGDTRFSRRTPTNLMSESLSLPPLDDHQRPHFVFPGGGIFFYWQAGVITYLREQGYDLSPSAVSYAGASAGSLTATLTATGVDFYRATELALDLAQQAGVWDRREGLQGIWGPLIYEWLDELLPDDAAERIKTPSAIKTTGYAYQSQEHPERPSLSLLVTPLDKMMGPKECITDFTSRDDLIECNMASVHIPWFLDGKLTRNFRNRPHIDGSFLSRSQDYMHWQSATNMVSFEPPPIFVLNHSQDPMYQSAGLFRFIEALSPSGIYGMLDDGKRYAKFLEENNQFLFLTKIGAR